ncbi:ABC transporter permease [Streptomyces sp. PU-14G]|uniref:ABC transporter permease n=1 Tax=Streptomyces sp. PU-14G TaxID=2800808 RepID=UPI0034E052BD
MSSMTLTLRDSGTMLRRDLRHTMRNPSFLIASIGMPVVMLLMFVGLFGKSLGEGVMSGGSGDYIDYVAPGIILMTGAFGSGSTAVSICLDMTEGIVDRFRTMAIARSSVLTGQVVGSVIRAMISVVLVTCVAFLMGFDPNAHALEWLAAAGVFAMLTFALTWLVVAFGLLTKNPAGANTATMPLQFLPFLSSAFVPTDSMPAGVRWIAEYQPFTPVTETMRGLLLGGEIGASAWQSVAWCAGIALVGYVWSKRLYNNKAAIR